MRNDKIIGPVSFSDWNKLIRVTAYVIRFISSCKQKKLQSSGPANTKLVDNPSAFEILEGKNYWIKWAQLDLPIIETKKNKLSMFKGSNEIIRLNGRLRGSDIFTFDEKHPILMSLQNPITKLILQDYHSWACKCSC